MSAELDETIPEMPDDFGAEWRDSDLHRPIDEMTDDELDEADAEAADNGDAS